MGDEEVVTFLEIDGKVLSGEEFEEYCKDHGLCRKCARVKTHRRVVKMFGRGRKWEPMTLHDDMTGEYTVYKGYCLQPTCFTLGQAKRLLGETAHSSSRSRRQRMSERLKSARRPGKRKTRANPETGSVMSSMDDDNMSVASDMSGMSAMSGISAMSGFSFGGFRRRRRNKRSSSASSASSISSMDSSDDDNFSVDSTMTKDVNPMLDEGEVNPIVSHRMERLTSHDYFTILDLSKVSLRDEDVDAVVQGISAAKTLESITFDKCKLKDEGGVKLLEALRTGNHLMLQKISMRQNSLGNKSADSLIYLLENSNKLEELDLSENAISSRGAGIMLGALARNENSILHTLNLSQNEIWDLDDGTYLRNTKTLKVLNLDGNFMHDEGARNIANAIVENKNSIIEKLFLGWNGVADDGATALANMMEHNNTIQVLGLAENDISNVGARAILSALSVNTSVREISGLYHNQIDRKFIIVAIKRLLHRYADRAEATPEENEGKPQQVPDQVPDQIVTEEEKVPEAQEESDSGSTNWASQMYSDEQEETNLERPTVAIEAIEQWDWGTFGIDEIEESQRIDLGKSQRSDVPPPMADPSDSEDDAAAAAPAFAPTQTISAKEDHEAPEFLPSNVSRITLFRSAPLAYFDRKTSEHHDVPLMDFDYEMSELESALHERDIGAKVEIVHEIATPDRFKDFFARGTSPILHYSGHGHPDCLALENGFGYLQAMSRDALKEMIALNKGVTKVVVISSVHALNTAKLFFAAGVKHVICCERENIYRDEGPVQFAKAFYKSLAQDKSLQEAFDDGVAAVKSSASSTTMMRATERYMLLPKLASKPDFHKIKVMFQDSLPVQLSLLPPGDTSMLPPLPSQFVGREVDMYEILESLRVDDVIRVGGIPGAGKATLLSAVSRYILARPQTFGIGSVYWLPPPPDVYPEEDSCYGDLAQVMDLLLQAEDDIWDEDLYAECRERIMIELEDQRTVLIIDGRLFTTEAAGENLEKFLTYLLNEVTVKIILLTAHEGSARTKRSRSEETMITIGSLDFKSTALLYGNSCPHVSPDGNAVAQTPDEFASFLAPPSLKAHGVDSYSKFSRRQEELYDLMGKGNPKDIVEAAQTVSKEDFTALLRVAQKPDLQVGSAEALTKEISKWSAQQHYAIQSKDFKWAEELQGVLEELEGLRSKFPSLDDLGTKEKELKQEYSELLKARNYGEANKVKRKILELKKEMLKEKLSKPGGASSTPTSDRLQKLQAKMDAITLAASKVKLTDADKAGDTFEVVRADGGTCKLIVSMDRLAAFGQPGVTCGIVCWTNEACDLSTYEVGQEILDAGGKSVKESIDNLETISNTKWGPTKLARGEATILGPRTFSNISARCIVLGVPPIPPSNDDETFDAAANEDDVQYLETTLRSTYRSALRLLKGTDIESLGISAVTTRRGGKLYERTLLVALRTIVAEIKTTPLTSVHILAASETDAKILTKLSSVFGLVQA